MRPYSSKLAVKRICQLFFYFFIDTIGLIDTIEIAVVKHISHLSPLTSHLLFRHDVHYFEMPDEADHEQMRIDVLFQVVHLRLLYLAHITDGVGVAPFRHLQCEQIAHRWRDDECGRNHIVVVVAARENLVV